MKYTNESTPILTTEPPRYITSPGEIDSSGWSRNEIFGLTFGLVGAIGVTIAVVRAVIACSAYIRKRRARISNNTANSSTLRYSTVNTSEDALDGPTDHTQREHQGEDLTDSPTELITMTEGRPDNNMDMQTPLLTPSEPMEIDVANAPNTASPVKLTDLLAPKHLKAITNILSPSDCQNLNEKLTPLTHERIKQIEKDENTQVDVEEEAKNVFRAWITEAASKATRQAVLDALVVEDWNNEAKENLEVLWDADHAGRGKLNADDIKAIIGQLGPNGIAELFQCLELDQKFVDRKKQALRLNVQQLERLVLSEWIQVRKPKPTIDDLLKSLINAGNRNAAEKLQEKWKIPGKIDDLQENKDTQVPGEGHSLSDAQYPGE